MKVLSIDTETTGKYPNTAKLLSIGAVAFEKTNSSIRLTGPITEIFFSTTSEVPASASLINGLTRDKLQDLSGGRSLSESFELVREQLYGGYPVIGYNLKKYDIPVITNNTMELGWMRPKFGEITDVYDMAKKRWKGRLPNLKLTTVFKQVLLESEQTEASLHGVFKIFSNGNADAHNAAWDAFMTLIVYRHLSMA